MQYAIKKENVPLSAEALERMPWFHLWEKRWWPYNELRKGDTLFFVDKKRERLLWEAEVVDVKRQKYDDKHELREEYEMSDAYFEKRAMSGYFLCYKVRTIKQMDKPRPANLKFKRNGWAEIENGFH